MACNSELLVVSGMAFEAKMAQGAGIRAMYGLNPTVLTADIEHAIRGGAKRVLSFGTCAGLLPAYATGTLIIGKTVCSGNRRWEADTRWTERLINQLPDAQCGLIVGVNHAIKSMEEKTSLRETSGAVAADMESHHVARLAEHYNVPFACLRVILDDAHCTLPPAALASTYEDGTINYAGLLGSLLKHPSQFPALITLSRDHARAKNTLLSCSELLRRTLFAMNIR